MGWTQLYPLLCLSTLGFLGYSDDPGIIPGWTQLTPPCLSILGFLGYSDDPRIIPGWMDTALPPLSEYPGILGILGRSQDHRGMDTALPPPLSEYPGIPGILGRSWDHPRMDTAHPPLSEYPGIPGILGRSQDHPGMDGHSSTPPPLSEYPGIPGILGRSDHGIIPGWMDTALPPPPPPCLSILGYSDDPRIIPGWTQSLRCPSILRLVVRIGVWYICTKCGNISFLINQLDFNCCKQ